MLQILANRDYRLLFCAQIVALLGTGLLTIALGLVAYDIAKADAGKVLATALTIKMLVYISISPIAEALTENWNRKVVLIFSDLIRAGIAILLPFIHSEWHIYVLIFFLQAASATFTPIFQALIPEILPRENDYTNALSLSRLAYDLENMISPIIAAILLTIISYHWLFAGTAIGFILSSFFIIIATIPDFPSKSVQSFLSRLTLGMRIYLSTARLKGLLSLNLIAASIGAMVIVNTVVIVKSIFHRPETDVAITLGAFGAGSMIAALLLPKLLESIRDRTVMLTGGILAVLLLIGYGTLTHIIGWQSWFSMLLVWFVSGLVYSTILTPSGRLIKKSSSKGTRSSLFAAQFSLSHLCWLLTYPMAGFLGSHMGMSITMLILGGVGGIAIIICLLVWKPD